MKKLLKNICIIMLLSLWFSGFTGCYSTSPRQTGQTPRPKQTSQAHASNFGSGGNHIMHASANESDAGEMGKY